MKSVASLYIINIYKHLGITLYCNIIDLICSITNLDHSFVVVHIHIFVKK